MGLATALHEAGLSRAEILAQAGLSPMLLDSPAKFAPPAEYFALWTAIRAVSGDPNIGIRLARSVRPDITEPFFLAMINAADVAGAIDVVARFRRLLDPEDLAITIDGTGQATLGYQWPICGVPLPQVLVDAELALLVELCRRGTGRAALAPREVRFSAAGLEDGAQHAAFFGCPLRLGAPRNAMVFAAADLALPFSTHNPDMLGALIPYLRANIPPQSAAARVRSTIAARMRGRRPDARAIAGEMAMSMRAMQRLLKESGTSFRQLLDEVRKDHAQFYLTDTAFTDGEIAFLLGFEDPNSFYRAFQAWHGRSPGAFRARRRSAG
ncbi:AraC family transcriptional regulator [Sphingosinicella sp.]|uniref:AraC family transcriptional regulator n=1 Tax=Sphingosinicella sp. TaxID=1917971 RepID=UPI004037840A